MFIKTITVVLAYAFTFGATAASVPSDPEMALATINNERVLNGLLPFTWNTGLATAATNWAGHLGNVGSVVHATEAQRAGQGEVIAHYTSTTLDDAWVHPITHSVNDWLAERASYPAGAVIGADSAPWIHWAQLMWSTSTEIGCGVSQSSVFGLQTFVVCRISPEGNVVGQAPFTSKMNNMMRRQDLSPGPFSGELTHYTPGLGACGQGDTGASGIIALSHEKMGTPSNGNPLCGRRVRLSANGRTAEGTVRDKCMGCRKDDIDVSEDLFIILYDDLGIGRAPVTWELI